MSEVGFQDIRAAARRIALAHRTPVMANRSFDERAGVEAYFKCENFQRGGAFKIRGAANFLYSMDLESRPRGVVGFSSGNHAQAVAIAAQSLGMKATLVMPDDAPRSKMEATAARGATSWCTTATAARARPSASALRRDRGNARPAVRSSLDHRRAGHMRPGTAGGAAGPGRDGGLSGWRRSARRMRDRRPGGLLRAADLWSRAGTGQRLVAVAPGGP